MLATVSAYLGRGPHPWSVVVRPFLSTCPPWGVSERCVTYTGRSSHKPQVALIPSSTCGCERGRGGRRGGERTPCMLRLHTPGADAEQPTWSHASQFGGFGSAPPSPPRSSCSCIGSAQSHQGACCEGLRHEVFGEVREHIAWEVPRPRRSCVASRRAKVGCAPGGGSKGTSIRCRLCGSSHSRR